MRSSMKRVVRRSSLLSSPSRAQELSGLLDKVSLDFDGDRFSDVYWYAPGTAADYIWWGNAGVDTGSSFTSRTVSRGGDPYRLLTSTTMALTTSCGARLVRVRTW